MVKIFRDFVAPILSKARIARKLIQTQNGKYIICYHGVTHDTKFEINNRQLDFKQFEKDILYFQKIFTIVNINDFFLQENNIEKPVLAITFDDGYLNNFKNVLPFISKIKLPVCIFLISNTLENDNYITWYDQLDLIKLSEPEQIIFDERLFMNLGDRNYFCNGIQIEDYIKRMGEQREDALQQLYIDFKKIIMNYKSFYPEYWKLVDKNELKKHVNNPMLTLGSHTHRHFNLGNIDLELVKSELSTSKSLLQEICPYEINTLAYPDGSYTEDVKRLALELGYTRQLAVEYQLETDLHDPHIANRYSYSNSTTHEVNMLKLAYHAKRYNFNNKFLP